MRVFRWGIPFAALTLLTACGTEPASPPTSDHGTAPEQSAVAEAAAQRPGRIILVSMDTVRADHVGAYGHADTTPNLDAIARDGILFRNFYASANYTLPATMTMLTGLHPLEHGIAGSGKLAPDVETLAAALAKAGFRAQAVHEGGYIDDLYGFDRGFEEFRTVPVGKLVREHLWGILDWMRSTEDPYFLFLQTYSAHSPYGGFDRYREEHPERGLPTPEEIAELRRRPSDPNEALGAQVADLPPETAKMCTLYNQLTTRNDLRLSCGSPLFDREFMESPHFESDLEAIVTSYDEGIRRIDRLLGQLRKTLVDLGQWNDTLLIVTSDHGDAFFEHGHYQHTFTPFEEVLRVPLVISYPRLLRLSPVRVVEGLSWHMDLVPTILAFAGISRPVRTGALNLVPVMVDEGEIPADRVVVPLVMLPLEAPGNEAPRRVAIRGDLKFIEGHESFGDAEGLLFDLNESPGESTNLRTSRTTDFANLAETARRYEEALERHPPIHLETGEPFWPEVGGKSAPIELPPENRERLRALGYFE